jgi:AraC family transcriptional activator of pobA
MNNPLKPIIINSISELHRMAAIEKPLHPMISLIKFQDVAIPENLMDTKAVLNLYSIFFKKNVKGKLKYGQSHYDFEEGVLGMNAPGQLMSVQDQYEAQGWWVIFHPDFVQGYPLATTIKKYGFFSYAVDEALHLSAREEGLIERIFQNIEQEYQTSIDIHSHQVMIAQLELLLSYSNRFYDRQFITRKNVNQTIVTKFETLLSDYFNSDQPVAKGLPNVQYFSDRLHVSSHYLSDMLRKHTGQNTQQHIHKQLMEKAKEKLSTTDLSVSEIAFQLGFEHAQSFSKLFKSKTRLSPLEFRQSFN